MVITHKDLDTPYSQLIEGATNPETPREFIKDSEREFEIERVDIDNLEARVLNRYIEFLDYLWTK